MEYNVLGNSDLKVSEISFGCMSLGTNDADNEEVIRNAILEGINLFDTADLYAQGYNEITLGKALRGQRKKVYIATKVGNRWNNDGEGWHWDASKEWILQAVEESLKRLQTDYIDLYQLHGGTMEDNIDEVIEAFELLKQQGKIRHYGISSIRPNVIREYVAKSNISSVMMQYGLLDRRPEEECLPLLEENNIGVLARGSLAKGMLVYKRPTTFLDHTEEDVKRVAMAVRSVSGPKRNAAQTALEFVLQNPAVTSAVVGIRTMNHLRDAVGVCDAPGMTNAEYKSLLDAAPAHFYQEHR
ncbi:aryl-alcohol dehydrogenase-like predicted oxidoreductase [Chitinophaga skermanii]|uniref:Aryl-alcohol dehydrogenase-like predicted oxidoreductase n=1 Tax=Chitinophaga skermanii TaxID=331697 RepID=A0A327R5C8_9BACT|nr:aldo/keto reductase [Chitinophaga skermanii]RAJ10904.1 aryl-alcohol dehydrogenase-like predicted oxidoreductase [Chitinophaga skermanii]